MIGRLYGLPLVVLLMLVFGHPLEKLVELSFKMVATARVVGVLTDPSDPAANGELAATEAAVAAAGRRVVSAELASEQAGDHTVGPKLADDISPTGWVTARGLRFSTHHDAPVAFPDSRRVLDATVTCRSRSGDILGPEHRVDVITALKAITVWPAWHHREDDQKGSIEPGKLADLVILDQDPTAVDPETLDSLKVVETIKDGETVFALGPEEIRKGELMIGPGGAADRTAPTCRTRATAGDG